MQWSASMDDLAKVESLARERIGLNPQAVHRDHIEDAIRQRMAACGYSNPSQYLAWIEANADELQELTECLVVVESWFFRDVQPFRFLERFVREDWNARGMNRPLRVLSVPCGSGEEPYSIAMTLLNLGIDAAKFHVDGVDLSQRALRQAQEGSYSASSFREREEPITDCRSRFFDTVSSQARVKDEVRAAVRFQHGNLIDPAFLKTEERYDVIFCRNLLIYLDAEARRAAFANLRRLLAKDGVLYVGHVEGGTLRDEPIVRYDAAYPFAFRARQEAAIIETRVDARPSSLSRAKSSPTVEVVPEVILAPNVEPQVDIESARSLANRGRLEAAVAQCVQLMAKSPANADIYGLLGIVRQAQGNANDAEKCFQKALYLNPRHHESLVHLALLASQRGDETAARNYARRAEKAQVLQ
jgi:chemotaxis protein methyltransferase WspC